MASKSEPITFISYSRADSGFALELAKELRFSGFNIWLDQLDIPAGCRWDDEVEKALFQCDIFLVILTPHSVGSNNVKDEIGYAIDSNKRIVPVLLENATVPFRLRRFQYVNFTGKTYEEGIESAKQLLRTQIDKLLSSGDWVPVEPKQEGVRVLPRRLVEQQRRSGESVHIPKETQPSRPERGENEPSPSLWTAYLIPILLGLALISVVCVFAVWVLIDSGKFQIPGLAIIGTTSTAVFATPTDRGQAPIDPTVTVSASTPRPVDTATFTFTPEPTNTSTAIIPTNTVMVRMNADDFLIEYFNIVINNHDLNKGWTLLTSDYQREGAEGWNSYVDFWNKVSRWEYSSVAVDYNSPPRARVLISFILYYNNNTLSRLNDRHYCLVQANTPEGWQIDVRRNCP